ncbi:MAG: hypothetical protein GWO24_23245 [Akkermansiaceae bacterium]|nr:hypothetical protein [Akkermansiaceae bacterium]
MSVRRKNVAYRYMWTAWLNLLRWMALILLGAFMTIALFTKDPLWFLPCGIAGGVFLLALLMFVMEAPSVRCLGCGGTLLRAMRCSKHETARRVLGSYTLYCTLVLASYARSVHCPYCGMRYRISRSTRKDKRREEEEALERERAEQAAKGQQAREESEARNIPYY